MRQLFRTVLESLLELLLPPHGRHRSTQPPPVPPPRDTPTLRLPRVRREPPLRGEDTALVRPYLVAHEQRVAREHHQTVLARAEFLLGVAA